MTGHSSPVCSVDGCGRDARARGWCKMHWMRWWRHGDPTVVVRPAVHPAPRRVARCGVGGCRRAVRARGWCDAHYHRWRRRGDVEAAVPLGARARRRDADVPVVSPCGSCESCDVEAMGGGRWCLDCWRAATGQPSGWRQTGLADHRRRRVAASDRARLREAA